ncbi:hypothetical protein EV401DRAFT_1067749 [Pisolithus croceorrhizus]|nr:hypothetical protein EV401DRAFT_1067749 [Pisolithus croceorrhizus]
MLPFRPIATRCRRRDGHLRCFLQSTLAVQNVFRADSGAHPHPLAPASVSSPTPSNPDDDDDDKDALPQPPPPKRRGRKTMAPCLAPPVRLSAKLNHSLIEKARRTKINDALATLRQLVPCRSQNVRLRSKTRTTPMKATSIPPPPHCKQIKTTETERPIFGRKRVQARNPRPYRRIPPGLDRQGQGTRARRLSPLSTAISGLIDDSPVKSTHMSVADEPRPSKTPKPHLSTLASPVHFHLASHPGTIPVTVM